MDLPVVAMCAIFKLLGESGMRWNAPLIRVQSTPSESEVPSLARKCNAGSAFGSPKQQTGHASSGSRNHNLASATPGCRATASMIDF